jgi:hypothetical protein
MIFWELIETSEVSSNNNKCSMAVSLYVHETRKVCQGKNIDGP